MQKNDEWLTIRKQYAESTGLPENIVDLLSVIEILKGCAVGNSNELIARKLDFDVEYITTILIDKFSFSGWTNNLSFSPTAIYKISGDNYSEYCAEIDSRLIPAYGDTLTTSFKVANLYAKAREELSKFGY